MGLKMKNRIFYKQLFEIVFPIAVLNFMSALVSASDALMLGWLNQDSLSAVSLASQIQFVQNLFLAAITIGLTILAAQYWGKNDTESVEEVLAIALRCSILVSFVFMLAALIFPRQLMLIFTADEKLVSLGTEYLRTVGVSYLLTGISQTYLCVMKNSGRVTRSTVYGSTALISNLILNAVLIFGIGGFSGFGIKGAAIATVLARIIELFFVLMENRKKDVVRVRWEKLLHPSVDLKKDFRKYTLPVLLNEIAWGCGFTMFSVIMGHLGSDAVAANSIANIVKNLIVCVALGIGSGSSIIVGNELGRGDKDKAREYGDRLCHIAILIGVISGLIILVCSPLIVRFSGTLSIQAKEYLQSMLFICAYYMIGKSVNCTTISGIFCAGGDTKFGFFCDLITLWAVVVPIGALAAFVWKLPILVVYFLLNLDEIIKLPAVYIHYKKYHWVKNLTER